MSIERIFPVVIARREIALLELTLASLREFREVIVHVASARDELVALCAAYPNTHVVVRDDLLGGRARNHGASAAAGEWILALTAGEFLSDSLLASLRGIDLDDPDAVYAVERHRLFLGQPMRWGGWRPTWSVRLYNRHRYQFSEAPIDERLVLARGTRRRTLKGTLWFEAIESLDCILIGVAERARLRRRLRTRRYGPPTAVARSLWTFIASFLLRLGWLEGRRGLLVAVTASIETFFTSIAWPEESRSDDTARTVSEEPFR